MKKISIFLSLLLVFGLVGCKKNNKTTTQRKSTTKHKETTSKRKTTDRDKTEPIIENKIIYVSNEGLEINDGLDKDNPTTLKKAIESMNTGDTIYLIEGTYIFTESFTIQTSGSEVKRNVINCENGVIFDFKATQEDDVINNGGFNLNGSYWEIDGLNVINSDNYGFNIKGRGNKIYNSTSSFNSYGGFNIDTSLSNFTNCISKNNMLAGYSAYGYYVTGSGENNVFDSCIALENQDSGFLVNSSKAITFEKCLSFSNGLTGDSASNQRSGFVFNNKGHIFNNCIAYDNALNGFLVPFVYAEKGSFKLSGCSSINNHARNYYLRTNNIDSITIENILSYNTYDPNGSNDYIIGNVKNSIMFYDKGYYYELNNPTYTSLDISKVKLDYSGYENNYQINLEIPEEMKEYIDLEAKEEIDRIAEETSTEPDYSSLEYNVIYFKDGVLNLYDYLDRSVLFQDELFIDKEITTPTYFGAQVNTIEEEIEEDTEENKE